MVEKVSPDNKNEQWLAAVLDSMTDGIMATDKRARIAFMNRAAEKFTGRSARRAAGEPLRDILHLENPATDKPLRIPTVRSLQAGKRPSEFPRSVCTASTGGKRLVDAVFFPIRGVRGRIDGIIAVIRDVAKVVERERATQDGQRIETIGSMASSIAREFGDYLGTISGHAFSIVDNLLPNTRAHDDARKILETTSYASGLTKRLTSIAAAGSTGEEPEMGPVDLQKVVSDAMDILTPGFAQQLVSFKTRGCESAPFAMADERQLLDCVINLFMNAAEAMPQGGVISVDCSRKTISKDNYIVLRVRDTGCGMPRDVLDRAFEPFFSTDDSGKAVGLGLTVVQNSVQRWGGFVKVRSQPGRGSSFRIFMRKAKSARSRRKATPSGGETLLIVDHRERDRTHAQQILQGAGYTVHAAETAAQFLDLFERYSKDIRVSIVDVFMPGTAGKTLLEKMTKLDPTAQIVMTSGFSRDYVRSYLERGAWDFVQKPLDPDQLLASVRRALSKRTTMLEKSATG